jgi:hypothetical protein
MSKGRRASTITHGRILHALHEASKEHGSVQWLWEGLVIPQ